MPGPAFDRSRAGRLTYFARVVAPSGEAIVPRQVELEATARGKGSGNRQSTRYSAHGLHEYKGRFNPQVVRAIGNMVGLAENSWVLDPFCGSGTTLLECAHAGWNSSGVDRNPLAIQIANAKLHAIRNAGRLVEQSVAVADHLESYEELSSSHAVPVAKTNRLLGDHWREDLPAFDYLRKWFPAAVLAQVVAVKRVLRKCARSLADRAVFETILSDHLRDASLQEPADLRIRRRKDAASNYPLLHWFIQAINDRLERVARARATLGKIETSQRAFFGDNRQFELGSPPSGGFDAVITSPPYETALPYIDTQRLSLVLFGHIDPSDIQATERQLTGAREISLRERRELERRIEGEDRHMPTDVIDLCRELLSAAGGEDNGFRRRNRPALVYRYFRNMAAFFTNLYQFMNPGGKVALVVGPSRTILSGREYVIDTPRLLASIARRCGYVLDMMIKMDTYPRYDLHQQNSIESEMLTVFVAPAPKTIKARPD